MEYRIKIIEVKEIKASNGQKFPAYTGLTKDGKKITVKFRRTANNIPAEPCTIVVKDDNFNLDNSRQYAVIWVSDVERIEPLFVSKTNKATELFDSADLEDMDESEGLPF